MTDVGNLAFEEADGLLHLNGGHRQTTVLRASREDIECVAWPIKAKETKQKHFGESVTLPALFRERRELAVIRT